MEYEVISFGSGVELSEYKGSSWLAALSSYFRLAHLMQHVVLWENNSPVREYHPLVGHV